MTGDDHGNGGTAGRFDQYMADSPPGCIVADWECIRGTSYIYPSTPLTDAQAAALHRDGLRGRRCTSRPTAATGRRTSLANVLLATQLAQFAREVPEPARRRSTNRTHCIVWSDYVTQPQVELANGIRLDTNYYYWPPTWVNDRPGLFTGSGMPMRFADLGRHARSTSIRRRRR